MTIAVLCFHSIFYVYAFIFVLKINFINPVFSLNIIWEKPDYVMRYFLLNALEKYYI